MSTSKHVSMRTRWRQCLGSYSIHLKRGSLLTSLCCGIDEIIQRTKASQHCTNCYLHGWALLSHELKYYVAVAAATPWVSEGVLNDMDDDRLIRNDLDDWHSLLQDVCFVENVSQVRWASLAALVGGDESKHLQQRCCPCFACSAFMVMRFCGDMRKMPWALCIGDIDSNLICLEAVKGEISNLVAWKKQRTLQATAKTNITHGFMLMRELPWSSKLPAEQAHGSTASIHKLHPMMGSEMIARRSMPHMSRALSLPDA